MYRIKLTARARRELKEVSKETDDLLGSIFEELTEDPLIGKPLTRELTGRFAYKVGSHRIIYRINTQNKYILIITAGHRSTIYN